MSSAQRHLLSESSTALRYPAWEREYETALLECDPAKLFSRVAQAEAAIFHRLQALNLCGDEHAERHAIEDAITVLRVVKRESLAFPDWEST
jgi:hypothetical protein